MGISVLTKRLKLDHKDWILRGFWDTTRVGESGYQRFNNKLNTWEILSALLWSMKTEVDTKKMKWTDTKERKKKTFWLAVLESCRGHFVRWACKWWWSWEVIKGKTGIWFVIIKYNYSFTNIIVLGLVPSATWYSIQKTSNSGCLVWIKLVEIQFIVQKVVKEIWWLFNFFNKFHHCFEKLIRLIDSIDWVIDRFQLQFQSG